MITLVLAAGKSQRFKDAGYSTIKQFLNMPDARYLLDHVLDGLNEPVIVTNRNEYNQNNYKFDSYNNVVLIDGCNGPLDATIQALSDSKIYPDQELLVVYSDVLFDDYDRFLLKCRLLDADSGCVLFPANGDRFDFHSDGWAYGAVYYFESFNRFLIEANGKLIDADLKDNLYGKICTYRVRAKQHIDLGTPEDYELYMAKRCKVENN